MEAEHETGTPDLGDGRQVAEFRKLLEARRALGAHAFLRTRAVAEQDAALGGLRHRPQHLEVSAHRLHQGVARSDRLGDLDQFAHLRERTGNRTSIRQLVRGVAVRGEPDSASVDGVRDHIRHLLAFVVGSLLFHGAFAHDVEAHRAVADHAGDVDCGIQPFDGVEIAAVVLPIPGQPRENGVLGDVLDGLHHRREKLDVVRLARREGDAAVAEQRRGDAVPANRGQRRVPADLRVQVGVQVHEPRGHRKTLGVDLLLPLAVDLADGGDQSVVDRQVAGYRTRAGSVDEFAATNHDVMCHWVLRISSRSRPLDGFSQDMVESLTLRFSRYGGWQSN